ncbi:NHL repeat-containing protein [Mucilaginibacter oryzae]|uniref:NHL repeat-containing protein n=1 Tax=Mucilaginibacter oryzae TaxID=468058 RepID=A0A316HEH5_9SPHI|nr:IPT/TIG domain-containing protein [Mucilaginibacter oryzae]PWK79584.1 NHL repeat-containing protein [Mucilaginibacter oryzae]
MTIFTTRLTVYLSFFCGIYFFSSCSKKDKPTPVDNTPKITITSLSADSGVYNASITIKGTGFVNDISRDKVFFNGKEATVTSASTTQLTALVPLSAGTGKVTVKVDAAAEVSGPVFNYKQSWIVSTFAGSGAEGFADGTGTAATFDSPVGITINDTGTIFVTDEKNGAVRKITADGKVTTIAGNGVSGKADGKGAAASFYNPAGICADKTGNLYIADYANNLIRKIDASANVTTIAGTGVNGFTNGAGNKASFAGPTGIVVNSTGELFVADLANEVIRKITKDATVSTFSSSLIPGVDDHSHGFHFPEGIAVDENDNLYFTDLTGYTVKKISSSGVISVVAGSGMRGVVNGQGNKAGFGSPVALAVDGNGNIYVTDSNQIRKIDKDANVTVFAGQATGGAINGAALASGFNAPIGIAADKDGNIYVADTGNNLIRKIALQ